jgi:hypothetical protein
MPQARTPGLLDIAKDHLFCKALWCGPCVFGQSVGILTSTETTFGGNEELGACCWLALSPLGILTNWMCVTCWHYDLRRAFLLRASLEETACATCSNVTCCSVCSLMQINRELLLQAPPPAAPTEYVTVIEPPVQQQAAVMATTGAAVRRWQAAEKNKKTKGSGNGSGYMYTINL